MLWKKSLRPAKKRELVDYVRHEHELSVRKACSFIRVGRSLYHYLLDGSIDDVVISAIQNVVERYPVYGFNKVFKKLGRACHPWNHKRCTGLLHIKPEPPA